ncbi:MAG: protein kinase domain-containing protein, partial [Blastocatellia bacterium]
MSPENWKKIDELLDAALDLPSERHAAFLDEVCEGDEELRRELESLLAAHQKAGSFIETTPAKGLASALDFEQAQAAPGSLVGRKLGHYQIAALLGAGGMGEVYRARDPRLDRNVAIKVLPKHLSSHPDAMARFEREAKAVAALSHPNILAIHDFGHQEGTAYLVMELLEGATLRQRLKDSVLNWREAVKISASIADGLAAAHAKGIIHRDIKPENVFLTNDRQIKVLDFGIARVKRAVASNAATLLSQNAPFLEETKPGTLMGTIGYMSPEQVRGENVEAPGDIFSLGCMLIEMMTGERPFTRPTAPETLAAILRDEPPAIDAADQDTPVELEKIVRRCLEKNPDERFQSARDLALDLRSLLTSSSGIYRAVSGAQRPVTGEIQALPTGSQQLRPRRARWVSPALAVALIIALGAAGFLWWKSNRTIEPPANSLAVLPLVNDGNDKSLEFLSDGISESIITNLSPLRPKLRVLASSSVRSYKGRGTIDPKQAGHELNVRTILTGRVLQQEDLIVI